jgi:hypothetical protein
MSTALDVETSTETLEDWEPEYICEATRRHEGGAPPKAEWWSIALCCGRPPLTLCSACVAYEIARGGHCAVCLNRDKPDKPNRRYEPIKGKQ